MKLFIWCLGYDHRLITDPAPPQVSRVFGAQKSVKSLKSGRTEFGMWSWIPKLSVYEYLYLQYLIDVTF